MKPKLLWITAIIAVVLLGIGFIGWRALQPKIQTAALAEILAVTPPELRLEVPVDSAARNRFTQISDLVQHANLKPYTALVSPKLSKPGEVLDQALKFKTDQASMLADITTVLNEGRLQATAHVSGADNFPPLAAGKNLEKCAAEAGAALAGAGQYKAATDLLIFSNRFADAMSDTDGPLIGYLVGSAEQTIALRAIQDTILNPKFPVEEARRLLRAIHAAPSADNALRTTLVAEYHNFQFPFLVDPERATEKLAGSMASKSDKVDMYGTFRPIDTAKILGNAYAEAMANTQKPYARIATIAQSVAQATSKGVPEFNVDNPGAWDRFKYRFEMNNGVNTLGRELMQGISVVGRDMMVVSFRRRAYQDAVRIHLAAVIYRASHGGSLPSSAADLASLLGGWPADPFNGKPMLYDRVKAVAYSVGENLVDDHGDIGATAAAGSDVGVSLGP